MALKKFTLANDLTVTVFKRPQNRSLRLSISSAGDVRLSIPMWTPYKTGLRFAESRLDWIIDQQPVYNLFTEGQLIGKSHVLHFKVSISSIKTTSRINRSQIIITHPLKLAVSNKMVQEAAKKAALRALRAEATSVLPDRLKQLAKIHEYKYKSVSIKQLSGRWGSCNQNNDIVLNLFLIQLPTNLIDYVLVHELVHTKFLNHGEDFWQALQTAVPDAKNLRKDIRKHKPVVMR